MSVDYWVDRETCPMYNWSVKAIRRKTTGIGRMRYLRNVPRRFKTGFREDLLARNSHMKISIKNRRMEMSEFASIWIGVSLVHEDESLELRKIMGFGCGSGTCKNGRKNEEEDEVGHD
ncbi:hypothetical protein U1Q18_009699 [Sarracenia purpurea var. burkii]